MNSTIATPRLLPDEHIIIENDEYVTAASDSGPDGKATGAEWGFRVTAPLHDASLPEGFADELTEAQKDAILAATVTELGKYRGADFDTSLAGDEREETINVTFGAEYQPNENHDQLYERIRTSTDITRFRTEAMNLYLFRDQVFAAAGVDLP